MGLHEYWVFDFPTSQAALLEAGLVGCGVACSCKRTSNCTNCGGMPGVVLGFLWMSPHVDDSFIMQTLRLDAVGRVGWDLDMTSCG